MSSSTIMILITFSAGLNKNHILYTRVVKGSSTGPPFRRETPIYLTAYVRVFFQSEKPQLFFLNWTYKFVIRFYWLLEFVHWLRPLYTEKTIFPYPFTVNGIWSWWQFLNQMEFPLEILFGSKTVTTIISHSLWKEMEI